LSGLLTADVITPLAIAILFWAEQMFEVPGHCASLVQDSKGDSVQFLGGLSSKLRRLPRLRRDSRSSISSPAGPGTLSTNEDAQELLSTVQNEFVFRQVQFELTSAPRTPFLLLQRVYIVPGSDDPV
jgi:hypothetical protein